MHKLHNQHHIEVQQQINFFHVHQLWIHNTDKK